MSTMLEVTSQRVLNFKFFPGIISSDPPEKVIWFYQLVKYKSAIIKSFKAEVSSVCSQANTQNISFETFSSGQLTLFYLSTQLMKQYYLVILPH